MQLTDKGNGMAKELAALGKKKAIFGNNKEKMSKFYDREHFNKEQKLNKMKTITALAASGNLKLKEELETSGSITKRALNDPKNE